VHPWRVSHELWFPAHIEGHNDGLVTVSPLLEMVADWNEFIQVVSEPEDYEKLRRHERTSRPLGDESFIERLEALLHRRLQPGKPGPKGPKKHKSDK